MSWDEVLMYVIKVLCGAIITVAIPYLAILAKNAIASAKAKTDNEAEKALLDTLNTLVNLAKDTITACVNTVNQTYVDALKYEGTFDESAQKKAFDLCKEKVLAQLTVDSKNAIVVLVGDLDAWITLQIENAVRGNKMFTIESSAE